MTGLINVRFQVRLRSHASSLCASSRVVGAVSRVKETKKRQISVARSSGRTRRRARLSETARNGRARFLTLVRAIVVVVPSNDDGSIRFIEH